ncbi:transcriptional regulator [Alloyangia pacifica]|uniref:transcriptional regulator n=1 Tax=Alloyangia pacifica TaxID=311180 RepID=UPI001CFDD027|nr:transcriptional regulator [Alloyangia pacifica]
MQTIIPEQIRAARAMLKITAQELADAARIGVATVRRAELAAGESNHSKLVDFALRQALEGMGVDFIPETDDFGPGVRLRKA